MDEQQQISSTLLKCLNHITVQEGTADLLQLSKSQSFMQNLLALIFQGINNQQVLIMALTTYKNFLKEYYNHATTPLPEELRKFARDTCQQLYFKIESSSVAVNIYKQIIYILVAVSYPWQGLDLSKVEEIEPNAYIFGQIGHVYEYQLEDPDRGNLENTINIYWPTIEEYIRKILQNYDQKLAKLLNQYLNMFYSSIHMELPKYLRQFSKIQLWLLYLKSIINYQIPNLGIPDNQNIFLKNQTIAIKTIRVLISQHCRQNEDYPGWANQFISHYVPDIFTTIINILFTKKHMIHQDVLSNIIGTIYHGYKNQLIRPLIMNLADKLMFQQMLPLIDYKDYDLNLFQHDTLEFIRREEDSTVNPSRWAAIDLIKVLIYLDYEGKSFLMKLIQYSAVVLKDPTADVKRKATVMLLISKFKTEVLQNKILKQQFGQLVSEYFFPYLSDPNPLLVYISCQLFSVYLVSVNLDKSIIQQLIAKLYDALNHSSLAVNFMSVLAFTSLLQDDSEAIQYVKPHFEAILKIYLTLIQKIDHQNLLKSLEKMIKFFDKEILSVGPQLIKHLITMFYKYAEKDEQQDEAGFGDNPASAALSTIRQLLDVDLDQAIYFEINKQITDILAYVVQKNLNECFEEIYDIYSVLTYKSTQLNDYVFPYLLFRKHLDGVLHNSNLESDYISIVHNAKKADPSYLESILSILKNLVVKMPRQILFSYPLPNTPDLLLCLIENKILSQEQLTSLDTSQVTGNWGNILQGYSSILYGVGAVNQNADLIKSFPSTISLFPWIYSLNDIQIFLTIIRKIISRTDDDDTDSQQQENLTPLQMMQKYAKEDESGGSDFQDGAFVDQQAQYTYNYNSPFPLKNDIKLLQQKLGQLTLEVKQQLIGGLSKNEYSKLEKILLESSQAQ